MSTLINFTSAFNSLALNDTEIGLFSAVVLLTPDRSGITDIKTIEQHQDRLMDALKLQVSDFIRQEHFVNKIFEGKVQRKKSRGWNLDGVPTMKFIAYKANK